LESHLCGTKLALPNEVNVARKEESKAKGARRVKRGKKRMQFKERDVVSKIGEETPLVQGTPEKEKKKNLLALRKEILTRSPLTVGR